MIELRLVGAFNKLLFGICVNLQEAALVLEEVLLDIMPLLILLILISFLVLSIGTLGKLLLHKGAIHHVEVKFHMLVVIGLEISIIVCIVVFINFI